MPAACPASGSCSTWKPTSSDGRAGSSENGTSRSVVPKRLPGVTDKRPFAEVVSLHGPTVLRVCRAVLGPVDADDAWSETFLSALKAYPELPAGANIEAWLVTIAHRKAIDVTRARARRAIPAGDLPEIAGPPHAESDDDLADALARLPDKQKHAVAYHYLAGL